MDYTKYLAIQGHETRNREVIKLLEMLGGKNTLNLCGGSHGYYYIVSDEIRCELSLGDNYKIYTLEDFFKKFPFKVGDFVRIAGYESPVRIVAMKYFNVDSTVDVEHVAYAVYCDDEEEWYSEEDLLDYNDIEDYKSRYTKTKDDVPISSRTLGIKGHSNRSEDVKSLLIMLGGRIDMEDLPFDVTNFVFYIGNNKCVYCTTESSFNGVTYSLEEFENKFPYKTGDLVKCWVKGQYGAFKIEQMYWHNLLGEATVRYVIHSMHFYPTDLQPYESPETYPEDPKSCESNPETSENDVLKLEVLGDIPKEKDDVHFLLPDGFQFQLPEGFQFIDDKGGVINTTKITLERIKPKYPKTYEECCDKLDFKGGFREIFLSEDEHSLYTSFIKLIRCRNAYWKIIGEEMGLDKPWSPDFANFNGEQCYYIITTRYGNIVRTTEYTNDEILVFPYSHKEIAIEFYNNFEPSIEICKELI